MDYRTLGRTGLRASVMGLGAGGPSRLGQSRRRDEASSVAVVRAALDAGVNFIDTAESYRTEAIVGEALREAKRDDVILSTKKSTWGDALPTAADVVASLEASLSRLGVEAVDIYHMHGVAPDRYVYVRDELVPVMERLRGQGKIRFLGITEEFGSDPAHAMLDQALADDCWDVMMVGFNLLNQTARRTVFPRTRAKDIGTLIMFAVRRALSDPARLRDTLAGLIERGKLDGGAVDLDGPLGWLVRAGGAVSIPDAAYRFCMYEPGCDVILSGTGSLEHLQANIASHRRPDLPAADRRRLEAIFADVDDVSGN
ncbi:MAG: aldo/keto reductase [Planctomycetes bacterium]|nr:aldo/keto reductase [Planctomycetota bacterium]